MRRPLRGLALVAVLVVGELAGCAGAHAATCTSRVGPGIPPPASAPAKSDGFHAQWWGQSGYPSVCPGDRSTGVVAYLNTGSRGWFQGRMGESAYLGTWNPQPGQDRASALGGDGTNGSPNTAWPRFNRVAAQPAPYIGPGQVGWFQFAIQAPAIPGVYRLAVRPLVEGAQWLEDFGVFWVVTVLNADGTPPPSGPVETLVTVSYFGPGLYGNGTACGLTLTSALQGVAHRTLPCGSPVTLRYAQQTVTVPVVDRGPYVSGREFDLTYATKLSLGCPDVCTLYWIH